MNLANALLRWFDQHGRHDLPWQHPRTPYRVWISEIMLQQTQVVTVIAYFERFMAALPSLPDLAAAEEDQVLALWSGLGYYRRARFAHQTARTCMQHHGGTLPTDPDALRALPGIGRSTAAAILAQAHGQRATILDGNVKRVLTRYHGIHGNPGQAAIEKQLWQLAEQHTPSQRVADYTQAIMDLGATICTRHKPQCHVCPLADTCVALRDGLTETLPERRARKALPERHTTMLIMRDRQQRVLMQRRGPQGVWAGLWSLPEADDTASACALADTQARIGQPQAMPTFTHTFSHYRLHVTPLLISATAPRNRVADDNQQRWCTAEELAKLGLPAPVRSLLQNLPWPATA